MTGTMKMMNPDVDQKVLNIMEEIVGDVIYKEFVVEKVYVKMMYPIYDKYFTQDDLKQMIEFNNTPLGKKIIKVLPMITQETIPVMQAFSQETLSSEKLFQSLAERFEKEGIN
jgi:hypothetical protein